MRHLLWFPGLSAASPSSNDPTPLGHALDSSPCPSAASHSSDDPMPLDSSGGEGGYLWAPVRLCEASHVVEEGAYQWGEV